MYIAFITAPFNYERLLEVMPPPSGVQREGNALIVSYCFETRMISGKQMLRVALIKKSIETVLDGHAKWRTNPIPCDGTTYAIDSFYKRYTLFKEWPKWIWPRHRKQLVKNAVRYAKRLFENDLLYYEAVLGAIYEMNRYMSGRIGKFEELEKKARYVMAQAYENIESGQWHRLKGEELKAARRVSGCKGGKSSGKSRKRNADERRGRVRQLLANGITDPLIIAAKVGVTKRTIYNDMKAIKEAS